MKTVTLVENTCGNSKCIAEHGLSIYIEVNNHKLLLDAGQSDAVVKNASALDIDLTKVDTVVLSHGHYDHSGGILPFSKINKNAHIIMQSTASEPHYNGERYIGIDKAILDLPHVELINGEQWLDKNLFLFSGITRVTVIDMWHGLIDKPPDAVLTHPGDGGIHHLDHHRRVKVLQWHNPRAVGQAAV